MSENKSVKEKEASYSLFAIIPSIGALIIAIFSLYSEKFDKSITDSIILTLCVLAFVGSISALYSIRISKKQKDTMHSELDKLNRRYENLSRQHEEFEYLYKKYLQKEYEKGEPKSLNYDICR